MHKAVRYGLIGTGTLVGLVAVVAGGGYGWAAHTRDGLLAQRFDIQNAKDIPIPWPLTDAEVEQIRQEKAAEIAATQPPPDPKAPADAAAVAPDPLAGVDLTAIAQQRAVERGKHLVGTIYGCMDCHGEDFGGHVVVDDPALGAIICPNITTGKGSVTLDFKPSDWDRIVRHGVRPDGSPTIMPAVDFQSMSDQELSDIVSYVRSFPPVDRTMDAPRFGPILTMLVATGQAKLSATIIDHTKDHMVTPPPLAADVATGEHLAAACKGCHGSNYSGGPIAGGDPSWPPAANLTPTGLQGWTQDDFFRVMREGKKKDGTDVRKPMPWQAYGQLSDVELQAIWAYIQTVPAAETGVR